MYLQWHFPEMLVSAMVEACSWAAALSLRQFGLPREKGPGFDTPGSHSREIKNFAFRLVQVQAGRPLPGRRSVCLFGRAECSVLVGRQVGSWSPRKLRVFAVAFPGDAGLGHG